MISVNNTHGYVDLAYCNKYSLKFSFNLCLGKFRFDRAECVLSCFWGSVSCKHFQHLRVNL